MEKAEASDLRQEMAILDVVIESNHLNAQESRAKLLPRTIIARALVFIAVLFLLRWLTHA